MPSTKKKTVNPNGANGVPHGREKTQHLGAYFLSLSLENVRCFGPNQTLDISDGNGRPARWTVIFGINGTGKTTLLQALAGFDPARGLVADAARSLGFDSLSFLRIGNKENAVFGCSRAFGTTLNLPIRDADVIHSKLHVVRKANARGGQGIVFSGNFWCCGYGASRGMGNAELRGSEPDNATGSLFSERAELRNPEEWLLRLDYAAAKESDDRDKQKALLEKIKHVLINILPDGEVEEIRLVSSSGTHPAPRAEFKTHYGWIPLRQLGYGYQTLITWVADFANRMVERYPESLDPLSEPAVVLVDEIDLHLHPVWQRKLISFLTERFPNTQFIATAHSPLVAQAAADANLVVLHREGDRVIIDNDVDNIRNWRIDQILTSDLFGLETARPPQIEKMMAERNKLLDKAKLTAADQRRVKEIEAVIGELPYGETPHERKERAEIREILDVLMKERKSGP